MTGESGSAAEALRDVGAELKREGRLAEAEVALRRALGLAPAARAKVMLGEVLLAQGRYAEAWPLMDARLEAPELGSPRPPLDQPEWRGEDLAGRRLLIVGEQGAGEQIMYARFAPVVAAMGADVTLLCMASLAALFAASLPVKVFAMAGRVDIPDPDVWALSASLPARLGVTPDSLPNAPYLQAAPRRTAARIGVMAQGNPRHAYDRHRSLPPEAAARLLGRPGTIDLSPERTGAADFLETAAIVAGLDLVISVDTAVAHLAGALGKPVWILLGAYATDWRWMAGRSDNPWYPTARLFRQTRRGDWDPVLDAVEAALP